MKKLLCTLVLGTCIYSLPLNAQDFMFDEGAMDKAIFEGTFDMCLTMGEYASEDAQCRCIFKTINEKLPAADLQQAQQLQKAGRTGSAAKIYKKVLSEAFKRCF